MAGKKELKKLQQKYEDKGIPPEVFAKQYNMGLFNPQSDTIVTAGPSYVGTHPMIKDRLPLPAVLVDHAGKTGDFEGNISPREAGYRNKIKQDNSMFPKKETFYRFNKEAFLKYMEKIKNNNK